MKRLTGIAALVAALACGDSRPLVPCSTDAECKAGRKCVEGYCESAVVGGDASSGDENPEPGNFGRIVFTLKQDGDDDVFLINADGTNLTNLTNDQNRDDSDPRWSPDGEKIVFSSGEGNNPSQIYMMDVNTKNLTQLTYFPNRVRNPTWSPDGRQIAFVSSNDNHQDENVYVLEIGSGDFRKITPDLMPETDSDTDNYYNLDWSPDGTKFVYENQSIDESALSVMDADGNNATNLTERFTSLYGAHPRWSPDGSSILFSEYSVLKIIDYASRNVRTLVNNSEYYQENPCWSPDGRKVAFSVDEDESGKLLVIDADGRNVKQIASGAGKYRDCDWSR